MSAATGLTAEGSVRILMTGSTGQLGSELVPFLSAIPNVSVISSDIKAPANPCGKFVQLDVTNAADVARIVKENDVNYIMHMASLLSATGERDPQLALKVNIAGLHNVLETARMNKCKVFAPSTIAVFGPTTPRDNTPDQTFLQPSTIYGITKVHLELLGDYYFKKFGVDFRSVRYPGIISHVAMPGGGTTDYAVQIFYDALKYKKFSCFLKPDSALPMMHMPDCIDSTLAILSAPRAQLKQSVYNVGAISFTPAEIAAEIKKHIPEFQITYEPDFRQAIADSWPRSLDYTNFARDMKWSAAFDLSKMVEDMLVHVEKKIKAGLY